MHLRIVTLGMEPYADFSLLTAYGRRMAKVLRHRSWVFQQDGTYRPMEVPGPDSFVNWDACFKVYEVIMLMLRFPPPGGGRPSPSNSSPVVTPIALETYHEAFSALARAHPEAWHLCQKAEDRCRAEHFPRLVRQILAETGVAPSWSQVFIKAALDDRYWDREVRRPAMAFIARGNTGKRPFSQTETSEAAAVAHVPSRGSGWDGRGGHGEQSRHRSPVHKGRGRGKQHRQHSGAPDAKRRANHPKKDQKDRYITTREGTEICYRFATGERGACDTPCPKGRAHVCQKCLQPHTNALCPKTT
jgi:hypothetical protein